MREKLCPQSICLKNVGDLWVKLMIARWIYIHCGVMLLSGFDSGSLMPFAAGFGETPTTDGISCLGESSYNKQNENRNNNQKFMETEWNSYLSESHSQRLVSGIENYRADLISAVHDAWWIHFIAFLCLKVFLVWIKFAACLFRISPNSNLYILNSRSYFRTFISSFFRSPCSWYWFSRIFHKSFPETVW